MGDISKQIGDLSPEKRELLELLLKKGSPRNALPPLIPRQSDSDTFPLSYGQKALWFLQQLEPDDVAYNNNTAVRILAPLDAAALRRAFLRLVERHAALRTTFPTVDGGPRQRVHPTAELHLQELDAAAWSEPELYERLVEEARRPFDLGRGPLLRVSLFSRSDEEHVLLLVMHHIVTDLWSMVLMTQEWSVLYRAEVLGTQAALPPLELQYTDFVLWQEELLKGPEGERSWAYWREQLAGELPVLNLPTDHPRPSAQTHRGASLAARLGPELTSGLKRLAQAQGVTPYMLLLAAYEVLLHRYTGQEDILVGSPTSGRDRAELSGIVGYFVNTVALRADLSGDPTFADFLGKVRQTVLGAFEHQDYPFALLTERLRPARDFSRSPIFQTMFVLQKAQMPEHQGLMAFVQGESQARITVSGLPLEFIPVYKRTSQFDLRLTMAEVEGDLSASFNYNTDLFEEATITRLMGHFRTLLEGIVADPARRISTLPLLTEAERRQLLSDWNDTAVPFPRDMRVNELIEAQAERRPEAVAVVHGDEALTYCELNARANRLAHYLKELGVGPEVMVGVCVERSLEMIIALLGILKAGGAYVPLDPKYPKERQSFIIQDARIEVLLTQARLASGLPSHDAKVVLLDSESEELTRQSKANADSRGSSRDAAYVIYTSGSTGGPKGVVVEHRSVVALMHWARNTFPPDELAESLASASINFDCSIFEIYAPLSWGGKIILVDNALELPSTPAAGNITLLNTVPSAMMELLRVGGVPGSVRTAVLSADSLPRAMVEQLYGQTSVRRVFNGYGPTEDTTFTTFGLAGRDDGGAPSIGRPIDNEQVFILNKHQNLVPAGHPGELYISGAGLARGYHNRPELTAEKFVPNPFSGEPGARMYRTGDLARHLPDGRIEFLGRIDHQVKVRGFRVELGEIESVLAQHPVVEQAVVLAKEEATGVKRLVAYVVARDPGDAPSLSELRSFVKERLPEYMIPAAFVFLDSMPLTPSGKINRRALPEPGQARPELEKEFVPPRNPTEELLADIWKQVLNIERVGVHDNFFELGGDSILSIQVVSRANQSGLRLTAKQVLKHQTIASLAAAAATAAPVNAEQGLVTGPVLLTPIQHWFFEQNLPEPQYWNISMLFEVRDRLSAPLLEQTVEHLLVHHDALRLRFERGEQGWRQTNSGDPGPSAFSLIDLSALDEAEQGPAVTEAAVGLQASLNLSGGPLLRVALFDLGPQRPNRLLVVAHHLAMDGVSGRILLEDLQTAYQQLSEGRAVQLPPKTTSFKQWAERLAEYARSDQPREELSYWLECVPAQVPALPADTPGGSNTEASARNVTGSLTAEETLALLREVPAVHHSQINDVLLTALARAVSHWTGESSVLINLEGHGREELFADVDLSRTVGWFTTISPLHLDLGTATTPEDALKIVKERLRGVPHKGIGYGVLRYLCPDEGVRERLRALPQAGLSFNYLGQFDRVMTGDAPFRAARESVGPLHSLKGGRLHPLDVSAKVANGLLQVNWTYSENLHQRSTVERLARDFVEELRSLIARSLLQKEGQRDTSADERGHIEEALAAVWTKVLSIERVGPHDNFFELGGDLSKARIVMAQVREAFEVEMPIQALLDSPTVAQLAMAVEESLLEEVEKLSDEEARQLM